MSDDLVERPEFSDEDMANVGRALMETLHNNRNHPLLKGWHPAQCPTEIVVDLLNARDDERDEAATRIESLSSEVERMREQIEDAELSLNIYDEGHVSEYWLRHPKQQASS